METAAFLSGCFIGTIAGFVLGLLLAFLAFASWVTLTSPATEQQFEAMKESGGAV